MKILFIVPYYKPAYVYGGPIVVISLLAENLVSLGHDVTVYTSTANGDSELNIQSNKELLIEGVKVIYFKRITKDNTYVSPHLWSYLSNTVSQFDLVHIHTWWNFLALGAALICKRKNIKPLISPHGMLSDYIFNKRHALAKKWIHILLGKKLLRNSWLHVSTQMEWEESKRIIPEWEGRIISNLIKLPNKEYNRTKNSEFSIGFLSRVDPKKGVNILIRALALVNLPYKLFIAGSGEDQYVKSLKKIAIECGNSHKIVWVGWKDGIEKFEFLVQMDLFALTSHSENFAIVVIEALSVGTPALVSNNVGLYTYINDTGFGSVTDMNINHIAEEISKLMKDTEKINKTNLEAPAIIRKDYKEVSLANQYLDYYYSIKAI